MMVVNGLALEVLEESMVETLESSEEIIQEMQPGLMTFSYNAFMGISSPTTTKVRGRIGKVEVVMLLDSGATHNFASPSLMAKLHILPVATPELDIKLGTGVSVKGMCMFQDLQFSIDESKFNSNFIALELGNTDLVLGVQWLRTFGKCIVDWEDQELSFMYEGSWVTIKGDRSLHDTPTLKMLQYCRSQELQSPMGVLQNVEVQSEETVPIELMGVLHRNEHIFDIPQGSERGHEHAIELLPNCGPSVCDPTGILTLRRKSWRRWSRRCWNQGLSDRVVVHFQAPFYL